jgi:hypothetical protein
VVHFRFFFLLTVLSSVAAGAEIPAGTALSVRLQNMVGTRFSKVGDPVHAVLLSPVLENDCIILPAGSELNGTVMMVRRVGLGFGHQTASLELEFHTVRLAGGRELSIDARMKRIETAKEWVDPDGRIHGIRPITNASSSLAVAAWRLLVVAPGVGAAVWGTKLLFAPAPDTEITFPEGTEFRLELAQTLAVDGKDVQISGLPTRLFSQGTREEARAVMDALPSQRAAKVSGRSADLVNLVLVGSVNALTRAFQAAGWSTSDPKTAGSVVRAYFSFMLRSGYNKAPMATMTLDGNRSDIELEKGLNTIARRHHLRIWRRPQEIEGESVWAATATEDTGIKFSPQVRNFTHIIDGNVDAERTKVVDDLLYTGCVSEAGLVERHNLPAHLENGTGTTLKTDGRVAVIRIDECAEPRAMPGVGSSGRTSVLRSLAASLRTELIRSNFVSLVNNGVRLSSATRSFFVGRPMHDDTGSALTRQQVSWLAGIGSIARKAGESGATAH